MSRACRLSSCPSTSRNSSSILRMISPGTTTAVSPLPTEESTTRGGAPPSIGAVSARSICFVTVGSYAEADASEVEPARWWEEDQEKATGVAELGVYSVRPAGVGTCDHDDGSSTSPSSSSPPTLSRTYGMSRPRASRGGLHGCFCFTQRVHRAGHTRSSGSHCGGVPRGSSVSCRRNTVPLHI